MRSPSMSLGSAIGADCRGRKCASVVNAECPAEASKDLWSFASKLPFKVRSCWAAHVTSEVASSHLADADGRMNFVAKGSTTQIPRDPEQRELRGKRSMLVSSALNACWFAQNRCLTPAAVAALVV